MASGDISFNGNNLQTSSIITSLIDHESTAEQVAEAYALAHANGSIIPFVAYPKKMITIEGTLIGTDLDNIEALLDTFRGYFTARDANLDIGYSASTRRYICTPTRVRISRPDGLTWATFSVELCATKGFGQNTSTTSALSASGRTLGSYDDAHTFLGNAPWQLPVYTMTYTALSGGTNKMVTVGNAATGQVVSITRNWASSDVLVVDATLTKVTVNGTEVDFTGAIPVFAPGSGTVNYDDNFTSRTFNDSISYTPRWL